MLANEVMNMLSPPLTNNLVIGMLKFIQTAYTYSPLTRHLDDMHTKGFHLDLWIAKTYSNAPLMKHLVTSLMSTARMHCTWCTNCCKDKGGTRYGSKQGHPTMSRLRLQTQPEESKDLIEADKLLQPYPNEGGIKTRGKEDPRDKAVDSRVPRNKQELQSLLGMFNYLGELVPNLAVKTQDLRALIKKNAEFVWEETHTNIFEALKAELNDNMTLQNFDPQKEVVIQSDAGQKGLGAYLLQDGKPVNFSSRSLIDAETRYCNLEREMLAVAWAVNRYRQYVYGRRFKIVNDHSPYNRSSRKT